MKPLAVAAVAFTAQLADLVTSLHGLALGQVETNPLIHSTGDLLASKAVATVACWYALAMAGVLGLDHPRLREVVCAVVLLASGATFYVAWRNLL